MRALFKFLIPLLLVQSVAFAPGGTTYFDEAGNWRPEYRPKGRWYVTQEEFRMMQQHPEMFDANGNVKPEYTAAGKPWVSPGCGCVNASAHLDHMQQHPEQFDRDGNLKPEYRSPRRQPIYGNCSKHYEDISQPPPELPN